jgi:3-methyladenine DNA glycosylase Tag
MAVLPWQKIHQRALRRKGGEEALQALLPQVRSARGLARVKDNHCLSQMTRCIFQAGFVWRVVNQKWEGFEDVFFGFPPDRIVMLSPEQIERIGQDERIIRNMQKVLSVQHNARYILDVSREHGCFGRFLAQWPAEDLVGLLTHMKKQGSRLGGMTGQRVLRNLGKDTWIVTGDVVRCVQDAGVEIKDNPTSARDMKLIQDAFNQWHQESGLPLAHLSRIAACSVGLQ